MSTAALFMLVLVAQTAPKPKSKPERPLVKPAPVEPVVSEPEEIPQPDDDPGYDSPAYGPDATTAPKSSPVKLTGPGAPLKCPPETKRVEQPFESWAQWLLVTRAKLEGCQTATGTLNGPVIIRDRQGAVHARGSMRDGQYDGTWEIFCEGTLARRIVLRAGKRDGPFTEWLCTGALSEEGAYRDDKPWGTWTEYLGGTVSNTIRHPGAKTVGGVASPVGPPPVP